MSAHGWLVIPRWEEHQHRDAARQAVPTWIKAHTRLLSDSAYLDLTPTRRAMLWGIWLEYARSRRRLPDDTATLSRRISQRVTRADLEALSDAGFLRFSAGVPAGVSAGDSAGAEKRREEDPLTPSQSEGDIDDQKTLTCYRCGARIAPRSACLECGATPRIAGTSARGLKKRRSQYERAEQFVRNVGFGYERFALEAELSDFELSGDERERLLSLGASLNGGANVTPNPFLDDSD